MARSDDAKAATRALVRHIDLLLDACLDNQGQLFITSQNERAIDDLIHHRFAFHLDHDDDSVVASRIVGDYIHHVTQSDRRRVSSNMVADKWDNLNRVTNLYAMAKKRHSEVDLERYKGEAQEVVYDLIDTMRQVITRFSEYVSNKFQSISDIELRIEENKYAIQEAERMNTLFETMSPAQIASMAGSDYFLGNLLKRILVKQMDVLSLEVEDSLHRLNRNLSSLIEENSVYQKQNRIIDAFLNHYVNNPGYTPCLPTVEELPSALRTVERLALDAEPWLESVNDAETLSGLAQGAVVKRRELGQDSPKERLVDNEVEIKDHGEVFTEIEEEPEMELAKDFFDIFEDIFEYRESISAMAFYQNLGIETTPEIWLFTVMNHFYDMSESDTAHLVISYDTDQVEGYSGNHHLKDIIFTRKGDHAL